MNIQQYNASLQPLKNLDINIYVLNYNFNIIDEISGVTLSGNISIDADADIRRTANISIALSGGNAKQNNAIPEFNFTQLYHIGDIVLYNNKTYQCVSAMNNGNLVNVLPTDDYYWQEYILGRGATSYKYWTAGNPYWFDKYIKIEVGEQDIITKEYVWNNMGIYLINSPTITYNATDNTLSFQAVDLMSKLTGMRNGYLEGIAYQIEAGANIVEAMRSALKEQGFFNVILEEPPTTTCPIDINIDIGSTTYELLTQLRDINPNWEMFFDVNGVFRFQQIPSGNETPLFGNEVWDKVGISYEISTDFESVKNYIEVVGKQIEPNETAQATYSDSNITITLERPFSSYYSSIDDSDVTWYIGFTIGSVSDKPTEFSTPISSIVVKDSVGETKTITINDEQEAKVYYNNESYFVRLTFSSTTYKTGEFGGYLQPRAISFETNPTSPFYVGEATQYTNKSNDLDVNFVPETYSNYIDTITCKVNSNTVTIDLTPYIQVKEYQQAIDGTQWKFKCHVVLDNNTKVNKATILYGGSDLLQLKTSDNNDFLTSNSDNFKVQEFNSLSTESPIYKDASMGWSELNTITLDFTHDYLFTITKVDDSIKLIVEYFPLSANMWQSPTTKIYSLPKFSKMVRGVCNGDEYDNIYSNDLTNQRAKYELYLQCRLHDSINIESAPLYWLDVNKVMRFGLIESNENLWIIKSISVDLSISGTSSINAMRYYPLYN